MPDEVIISNDISHILRQRPTQIATSNVQCVVYVPWLRCEQVDSRRAELLAREVLMAMEQGRTSWPKPENDEEKRKKENPIENRHNNCIEIMMWMEANRNALFNK